MGGAKGTAKLTERGVVTTLAWREPHSGHGHETFRLVSPTELHVSSELHTGGQVVRYTVRYTKKRD
jgi:hypothetical protein